VNEATSDLAIVIAVGVILICLALIVVWWKMMSRRYDNNNSGGMPDYDPGKAPALWKVHDFLDPNQVSDEQFQAVFGMSRDEWIENNGGLPGISLFQRWRLGKISDEQFNQTIEEAAGGGKAKKRKRGVVDKSVYRRVD
jgi:nitrogen fixation-related uncharacterized protein